MSTRFTADEIFEMALVIERNGADFYRRAASFTQDDRARDLLLNLAQREVEHEAIFTAMRAQLTGPESKASVFDPEGEAALYLRAMADREVFNPREAGAGTLTGQETYPQILRAAIAKEKDSVVFYVGMKEWVPQRLGRDRIEEIIKEEMRHIRLLSEELAAARK